MSDSEIDFINKYEGPQARRAARDLYRALHPTGMHTNGPTHVQVEASHLMILLQRWKIESK